MWQPRISTKQAEIINSPYVFNLVSGPRKASKSFGCLHDIPWHMWNTPSAVGMMLGCTTSQNSDSGLWTLLNKTVIPDWVAGRIYDADGNVTAEEPFGFELVTEPRMEAVTHKLYFETNNRFGGTSRYYLDSLDVETDAEEKFKGKIFTHIYGTEFSNFKLRKTFDVLRECFRAPWIKFEQHKMVLDTNPAEEGEDHWLWQLFYWSRTLDYDNLSPEALEELNLSDLPPDKRAVKLRALKRIQAQLGLMEFTIDDNCFISEEMKEEQFAIYAHDKDLLDRYYYGRWVRASGDGIFSEVWRPQIHMIGDPAHTEKEDPEFMVPEDECIELGSGSDIGRRNTAVALIEPIQMEVEERTKTGTEIVIKPAFKILDEYVSLGCQQRIATVAMEFQEKVEYWASLCKKPPRWRHISDSSAFSPDLISETDEAKEIYRLTNGLIELESIIDHQARKGMKGHGAVEKRISLIQRLLFENRILINRKQCPNIAEMFSSIRRSGNGKLSATNIFKHAFDAVSYYIAVKCWLEMIQAPRMKTNRDADRRIIVTTL